MKAEIYSITNRKKEALVYVTLNIKDDDWEALDATKPVNITQDS